MDLHHLIIKPGSRWLLIGIVFLALVLRFAAFPAVPEGIHQDEMAAGYESYSLLHHHTDRWGNKWPVYFVAWGSGQNVLESYLEMPVIAVFGLTAFAIRIVPDLLGAGSVILLFFVVRKTFDNRTALLSSLLLAVLPWAVLSSRWGLESNILPFFMLLGVWALIYSYTSRHAKYLIPLSLVPFAVALYAYAISIFVIPVFLAAAAWLLRDTIRRNLISAIASGAVFLVVAFPLLLFFAVNMVLHRVPHVFSHLPFSTPLLLSDRLSQVSSGRFAANTHFFASGFVDNIAMNMPIGYAPLALIPIPLAVIGCVLVLRQRKREAKLFSLWFLAGLVELFVADLNMNRANTLMIPMVVLASYAAIVLVKDLRNRQNRQLVIAVAAGLAIVYCGLFYHDYFTRFNKQTADQLNTGLKTALQQADDIAKPGQPVYVSNLVNLNYLQTLFYTKADSLDFHTHADYAVVPSSIGDQYQVERYRQYYFDPLNKDLEHAPDYVFVLKAGETPACKTSKQTYVTNLWRVGTCYGPVTPKSQS